MAQIGVPQDDVIEFELALKVDKFLLMVHVTAAEVAQAREVLSNVEAGQAT